jgi:peptidoglycan/LPS O-acetylase OafA/YrhL
VLAVIFFHSYVAIPHGGRGHHDTLVERLALTGWLGVDVFFVLSGFLITGILLGLKGRKHGLAYFYVRRVLRIFPLYYLFLIVGSVLVLVDLRTTFPPASTWVYLTNLFPLTPLDRPYHHLWSLAIEEQYYLIWPVIVLFVARRTAMFICGIVFALSLTFRCILAYKGHHWLAYTLTSAHLDGLAIGSWIALGAHAPQGIRMSSRKVLIGSSILAVMLAIWRHGLSFEDFTSLALAIPVASFLTAGVLLRILEGSTPRPLEWSASRSIGRYSYAMYLFHWPILLTASRLGLLRKLTEGGTTGADLILGAIVTAILSYMGAFISWHLYEKRFLELKRYFPMRAKPEPRAFAA